MVRAHLRALGGPVGIEASDELRFDIEDALSFWYRYGRHPHRSLGRMPKFMTTSSDFRFVDSRRFWQFTFEQTDDLARFLWPADGAEGLAQLGCLCGFEPSGTRGTRKHLIFRGSETVPMCLRVNSGEATERDFSRHLSQRRRIWAICVDEGHRISNDGRADAAQHPPFRHSLTAPRSPGSAAASRCCRRGRRR